MSRSARVPSSLRDAPFRGREVVSAGLLTRDQLRGSVWRRLLPDIYVHRDVTVTHHLRCDAAGLYLDGRGVVSGLSAAHVLGVDAFPPGVMDPPVEVTVPRTARVEIPGLVVVRSALPAEDVRECRGVPVTSPARTAFDIGRRLRLWDGVPALDAMLYRRVVFRPGLEERAGWPGARRFRTALRLAEPKAESPMESRLRLVLIAGRLPRPVVQHKVFARNGRFVARLDLAYAKQKLGVEYEGDHHRGRETFQWDLRRNNELRNEGWTVLRFGADDVLRRPGDVVAAVRAALRGA